MPTAQEFIAACRREVGYTEQRTNRTRFAGVAGHANGYAWCQTFLNAIARETGLALPVGVPATAYTPTAANCFKAAGLWSATPEPGAWGYLDFPGDSTHRISHVCVVTAVNTDGTVQTIEGNTSPGTSGSQANGGGVYARRRPLSYFKGFGLPNYTKPAPAVQEDDIMRCEEGVTIPAPDDKGRQTVLLPLNYTFNRASGFSIKANNDGTAVPATVQSFECLWPFKGALMVSFTPTNGLPAVAEGRVGVIFESR